MKTETAADLNVLHERRSKAAAEGYERRETALKRRHQEETSQLTEKFQAAEDVLKVKGHSRSQQASCGGGGVSAACVSVRRPKCSSWRQSCRTSSS